MSNSNLRSHATGAMLAHAFFRLESAGTIALTILLSYFAPQPFDWWQWWYWLVIGGVAEALIIYTSLSDVDTGAQVVADMLREEYNPGAIKSKKYRAAVERALDYRTRIEDLIRHSDDARSGSLPEANLRERASEAGILHQHLQESTSGISDWIGQIFRLARRLDEFERDAMLKQDLQATPAMLQQLNARVVQETDAAVREQAKQALASKQAQWQNLQKLARTMDQADLQLDATLTALGTVYSQLMLIRSKDDVADGRAQRLRDDVTDQIAKLASLQEAMDEVYGYGYGDRETKGQGDKGTRGQGEE
jgi:hypothetical protein